jgi:hypothetical protein
MRFFKPFIIATALFSAASVFAEDAYQDTLSHEEVHLRHSNSGSNASAGDKADLSKIGSDSYRNVSEHKEQVHGSASPASSGANANSSSHIDPGYGTEAVSGDA